MQRDAMFRLQQAATEFAAGAGRIAGRETLEEEISGPKPQKTTVLSNYSFLQVGTSAGGLREVRQVMQVNGKPVKGDRSLDSLAKKMTAVTDGDKRKLLEDFKKHGLASVVTDIGQLIVLFLPDSLDEFEFSYLRTVERDVPAHVYSFQQLDGKESLTIYNDNAQPVKQRLKGEVWLHSPGYSPFRIALDSERDEAGVRFRDTIIVDYAMSEFGFLLPAKIIHYQFKNGQMEIRDTFQYAGWRLLDATDAKK